MKTHKLKILPKYFREVERGTKTFEVRFNDRDFQQGDIVILQEYEDGYTGNEIKAQIGYILKDNEYMKDGYVAFSLLRKKVSNEN